VIHRRTAAIVVLMPVVDCRASPANTGRLRAAPIPLHRAVGNHVIAIAGVPNNPNVYCVGATSGGIFKRTDSGTHWDAS